MERALSGNFQRRTYRLGIVVALCVAGISLPALRAQAPLDYVSIQPCRLVDTRNPVGPLGGPSLPATTVRSFPILSASCGIPSTAVAYSLNVTVVPTGFLGYLTVWPTGGAQPVASTLNSYLGVAVANAAIVEAGTNGAVSAYATNPTDVILDINGYFLSSSNSNTQSTAIGAGALSGSNTGVANTAFGVNTLEMNTTGSFNVGLGASALSANTTGSNNTAVGSSAMQANTAGEYNSAFGYYALTSNAIGNGNTAVGYTALYNNQASDNTAVGLAALANSTTAGGNTALGYFALSNVTIGGQNIAIGTGAGQNVGGSGSYNIEIGNPGTATDSNVIRIGASGQQTSTYIAGISNASVTGSAVLITTNGQLGTLLSSRVYKEDIQDIGPASEALMQLRPVTFRYKQPAEDGSKPLHYGLIAEEVAKIYPDLVVRDQAGRIQTVQYLELPALLLNEVQKQHETIQKLEERIAALESLLEERSQLSSAGGR
ncbi:MAG: tail fiber domain-containing protein [Acidobacteriaceae bacterium]|nr:tail fiber domain-containing protein [Acidobacteriaceae bacterium]MBV9781143.1 tail fiber domain-containing protein [Acidobacteriaceae bacterium]